MKIDLMPFLLISFILLLSCEERGASDDNILIISDSDFGDYIKLAGEEILFDDIVYKPFKMTLKDSILIVYNVSTEYAYQKFNIKTNKYLGESILIGNGPGEMLYPNFIQSSDTNLWLYDQQKSIVSKYDIGSFIKEKHPTPLATITLKDRSEQLSVIRDKIFSFKLNNNLDNNRFNIFDLNGTLQSSTGSFPYIDKNKTFEEVIFGFTSDYSTNFKDRIFLSYRLTDLIEIYDVDGSLIRKIQGADRIKPSVKAVRNESVSVAGGTEETRETYFYPANAGEEVFVTYSGELYADNVFHKRYIYVFDWDGNPLRRYLLDIPIYGTVVDPTNRIIYGFSDEPECHIVKFNY